MSDNLESCQRNMNVYSANASAIIHFDSPAYATSVKPISNLITALTLINLTS